MSMTFVVPTFYVLPGSLFPVPNGSFVPPNTPWYTKEEDNRQERSRFSMVCSIDQLLPSRRTQYSTPARSCSCLADSAVHQMPIGQIVRQQPPGAATAQQVENRVDDLAPLVVGRAAVGGGGRDQRLQEAPLRVRQISRIGFAGTHTESLATMRPT